MEGYCLAFRMYAPNGAWFKKAHGVNIDIKLVEDFQKLANGIAIQLEAGIKIIKFFTVIIGLKSLTDQLT